MSTKIQYFDAHCHLPQAEIAMADLPMDLALGLCSIQTNDWEPIALWAQRFPNQIFPALGILPWFSKDLEDGWEQRLASFLEKIPGAAVGECGLDALHSEIPMEKQQSIFSMQRDLAHSLNRPLIIHCVRALPQALEILGKGVSFMVHRFGGNALQAKQIIQLGGYISLHPERVERARTPSQMEKLQTLLQEIPTTSLLLESDTFTWNSADHEKKMLNHATQLAKIKGIPADTLLEDTRKAALNFYIGGSLFY